MTEFLPEIWIKEYERYQIERSRLNKLVFKGTKEDANWIEKFIKYMRINK